MELDDIIEELNKKENIASITISNLQSAGLSEAEQHFIAAYQPEKALIIYGSLGPGRSNHSVMEHIPGIWKQGVIRGKLEVKGWGAKLGYPGFTSAAIGDQKEINAFVFFSDELVANWQMLDEFEGAEYKRTLAKYELDSGEIGVAYIYAIR